MIIIKDKELIWHQIYGVNNESHSQLGFLMFVGSNFNHENSVKRLGLAVGAAIFAHGLVLAWLSFVPSHKILESDLASPPTNITINFLNPVKDTHQTKQVTPPLLPKITKPKPVVKKLVAIKPIKIPEKQLNKIEPAAAAQQAQQPVEKATPIQLVQPTTPSQTIIPVISDANIKGRRVQPKYPDRALRMKQEGVVWLRVLISETGTRQEIKIYKPTKYALLNQAAMKAVKKWTFDPNVVNGRPTKSWVEIPIEFKIQ